MEMSLSSHSIWISEVALFEVTIILQTPYAIIFGHPEGHSHPGVHDFWEVWEFFSVYTCNLLPRFSVQMKITDEKWVDPGCYLGEGTNPIPMYLLKIGSMEPPPWIRLWLLRCQFQTFGSLFENIIPNNCQTHIQINWPILSQAGEVAKDQSQQDQVQETDASTFLEVGTSFYNLFLFWK